MQDSVPSPTESLNQIKFEQFGSSYPKLQIIPTVDISKGRAVLVNKGEVAIDNGDVFERVKHWSINSDFQITDIDAAKGTGDNSDLIKQITKKYSCYVAGGVRTVDIANDYLSNNVKRVCISTSAINSNLIEKIPNNRLIVALDIDDNYNWLLKGRTEQTTTNIFDVLLAKKQFITVITVTFHSNEGTGSGLDFNKVYKIKQFLDDNKMQIRLVIAGGIKSVDEIKSLLDMNVSPQFGYALWRQWFSWGDIYSNILNYTKLSKFQTDAMPVLVPCIIIRTDGVPLSLTYSDKDGIKETVDTKELVMYSRSKNKRWKKGTESGNVQHIVQVSFNCDRTSLLYVVEGKNFCSKDKLSCFNYRNPSNGGMRFLEEIITASFNEGGENENKNKEIMENSKWWICKILDQVNELGCHDKTKFTKNDKTVITTISDLIFYLTLYSVSLNIKINDIYSELTRRHFTLSKPKYIVNQITSDIKWGICLNKDQEEEGFKYFSRFGLNIAQDLTMGKRSLKYTAILVRDETVKICAYIVKAKDIIRFFDYGYMDCVICYKHLIENEPCSYEEIKISDDKIKDEFPIVNAKILVLSNSGFSLDNYKNKGELVTIYTEFMMIAKEWANKKGWKANVVQVSGESEGYLINGLCDWCVCILGKNDIEKNELTVLDVVYESELGLFTKEEYKEVFSKNIVRLEG